MIKLWILDRNAGLCIFEQAFEDLPKTMASDLVTGFFYAILTFSHEIASQDVEFIQMRDIRIMFHGDGRVLLALATKNEVDQGYASSFLHSLEHRFSEKYQVILEKGQLNNTSLFVDFAHDVETELGRKSTSVSFIQTQAVRFKQYYENAKKDFIKLKQNMTQDVRGFTTPLVDFIKNQVTNPKYKLISADKISRVVNKKARDDPDEQ